MLHHYSRNGGKKKSVSSISDLSNVNSRRPTPLPLPLSRSSVGFAAARGPRVRVGHVVVLEARVRCALPLTLTLRGEERVLETHAGGCGLCAHKIYKKKKHQWLLNNLKLESWVIKTYEPIRFQYANALPRNTYSSSDIIYVKSVHAGYNWDYVTLWI